MSQESDAADDAYFNWAAKDWHHKYIKIKQGYLVLVPKRFRHTPKSAHFKGMLVLPVGARPGKKIYLRAWHKTVNGVTLLIIRVAERSPEYKKRLKDRQNKAIREQYRRKRMRMPPKELQRDDIL